ncbi:hypothetical protein IAU60_000670 [Kwoniella sp. DSM 27419]
MSSMENTTTAGTVESLPPNEAPVPVRAHARDSVDQNTLIDPRVADELDTHYAAQLKPSRATGRKLHWLVTVAAGMGFLLFGYDQGVLSSLLTLPSFEQTFPNTTGGFEGSRSATLQSFLVAIYELGCMMGALSNIWVGDRLGRRRTMTLGACIMVIGAILQTAAIDYAMMLVARVVTGVGNGLLTSTVPTYQSECAKPEQRGQLVLISGSLITFGIMLSYWIDLGFYYTSGTIAWRFPVAIQILFAASMVFCLYVFKLPESPRWLASKGKYSEALAVLAALEGTSVDDKEVINTFNGICDAVANEEHSGATFGDLFTRGKSQHLRRMLLGVVAQCFQQICGINLITYYLTSVLTGLGLGPEMSRIISGVNGTCYFLTSIIALFVIERAGRRPLMFWTSLLQAATMAILAGLYNKSQEGSKPAQVISVLCLFLFNTWFSVGWLGMTWLYPAEVTPLRIRVPANALSTSSNWIFNFMVVMATGPMFANIGWGTYALFAAINGVIIAPSVWFFFPETKRYSLEQLDVVFALAHDEKKSPVWYSKRPNEIPLAGSKEAERILGREPAHPNMVEKPREAGKRGGMARVLSREKDKPKTQHSEYAAKQV